ncbi:MAG: chorismate transformation enzyme, FkbO/Hyg5 family [Gammaproteobacteria bacterium]|nr:hypothetical protein [Gammaproteobacteria bacterium]
MQLRYWSASELGRQRADELRRVLGVACFSVGSEQALAALDIPQAYIHVPPLIPGPALCEAWVTDPPLRQGVHGKLRYCCSESILFGVLTTVENASTTRPGDLSPGFACVVERMYSDIFDALDVLGFPHLWRVWNHVPDINRESDGLERYRQFNIGRQDAFKAHGRSTVGVSVPAASTVGLASNAPLVVHFIAACQPATAIENPRQISAYHYPELYGPRSPTFSRATLAEVGGHPVLFVSGTASIVGHQTQHAGNVVAQARETLRNIESILDQVRRHGEAYARPSDLLYKVYVRYPQDRSAVAAELRRSVGDQVQAVYLQADICRRNLLVEIEATALYADMVSTC